MAVDYPTYPVTTLAQAEDMIIFTGNQIHDIMNADATSVIEAEDGQIPSIRKALVDNMYFKPPQDWVASTQVTDPLQLKQFTDGGWYFAPTATVSTPVSLGATPIGDTQWKPWSKDQAAVYQHAKRLAAEAGYNMVSGSFYFGGTLDSVDDVLFYEGDGKYYSWSGAFPKVVPAGSTPATSGGVGAGAWVDRTDLTLRSEISGIDGAGLIGSMSYAQLRAYSGTQTTVNVWGINNAFDGAAGQFKVNASDITSTDNGGTILVDASGRRWCRVFSGHLDVHWFGADSTGLTDSTSALQKAFNSGFDVNIPDGIYLISGTLTASTQGARITASPGAIIKKTTAEDAIVVTASNWELIGVRVNCNGFGASGIGVKGANNLISGCEVYGSSGVANAHGIYLDGQSTTCIYNRVVNNWVHQVGGVGIASNTAPDNIKEGNVVFQTGLEGITDDLPSYRSVISGNYINAACQIGGVGGIGIDQASDGVVTNNVVNSTGSGLPGIRFQNNVGNTNHVTVTGNALTNNPGGGIHLYNNVESGFKAFHNVISANIFQNNTGFDIKIDAGCTANSVSGNGLNAVIIDLNAGGVNTKPGILCSFRAFSNTLQSAVTGDGTVYQVKLGGINYNNGTPWNTSTNSFTAPVSGIYSFSGGCRIQGGGPSTYAQLQLVQTGSTSQTAQAELDMTTNITLSAGKVTGSGVYNLHVADHFAMRAGDTLVMKIIAAGSTKTMDIPSSQVQTWLSGVFIG